MLDLNKIIYGDTISIDINNYDIDMNSKYRICIKNIDKNQFVFIGETTQKITFPTNQFDTNDNYVAKIQKEIECKWIDFVPYFPLNLNLYNNFFGNNIIYKCPFCESNLVPQYNKKNDHCPKCNSTARHRALYFVVKKFKYLSFKYKKCLLFSSTLPEKNILQKEFNILDQDILSCSLYGDYLPETDHITGVDVRDLSRFPDKAFHLVFSSLLFDYFVEHEIALSEISRCLDENGLFLTHISPSRLLNGNSPPKSYGLISTNQQYMSYIPSDKVHNVKVSLNYFISTMKNVNIIPEIFSFKDKLVNEEITWICGFKKSN